ncbi:hypothetical protein ACFPRL_34415 [Pseudoclavibacter helvolus]
MRTSVTLVRTWLDPYWGHLKVRVFMWAVSHDLPPAHSTTDAESRGFARVGFAAESSTPADHGTDSKPMGFASSHEGLKAGGALSQAQSATRPTAHKLAWC